MTQNATFTRAQLLVLGGGLQDMKLEAGAYIRLDRLGFSGARGIVTKLETEVNKDDLVGKYMPQLSAALLRLGFRFGMELPEDIDQLIAQAQAEQGN